MVATQTPSTQSISQTTWSLGRNRNLCTMFIGTVVRRDVLRGTARVITVSPSLMRLIS